MSDQPPQLTDEQILALKFAAPPPACPLGRQARAATTPARPASRAHTRRTHPRRQGVHRRLRAARDQRRVALASGRGRPCATCARHTCIPTGETRWPDRSGSRARHTCITDGWTWQPDRYGGCARHACITDGWMRQPDRYGSYACHACITDGWMWQPDRSGSCARPPGERLRPAAPKTPKPSPLNAAVRRRLRHHGGGHPPHLREATQGRNH